MKRSLLLLAMLFTCFGLNLLQADDAAPQPSPDEELRSLQGDWKVTWSIGGATTLFGETPRVIQSLQRKDLEVKIEEDRLSFGCTRVIRGETLTLCNELPAGMVKDKSPLNGGGRYVLLTTEEGNGLLASYARNGDSVTFRYPAGCCSRSGNVITLTKVK